ncbi:hypothetical protein RN001_002592 [Aquatica leii]|uniref:Uncharacterized protein n=1 Tax=Aquatica leii TaxID=1421715 RepID=A0AAN7SDE3_9COLE|nr:hypothetical protein RN001_002592 [Aquatica leii]
MISAVYLVLVINAFGSGNANVMRNQNKRSIDLVLRSVADVFGYDVLKRPSALPTTPSPAISTYPPPLQKLPPLSPAKPSVAPPKILPPKPALTPAPILPKLLPPPKPLLTDAIQKSFNINFSWNRNVGTPAPPASLPEPQTPKTVLPPPQSFPPKSTVPSLPPTQINHRKPQLYHDYDYNSNVEPNESLYDYDLPRSSSPQTNEELNYDYPDYTPQLNQDYSETTKKFSTKPLNDVTDSKQKFKSSVKEFWKTYPLTEQQGYKYIAPQENRQYEPVQNSKYEEYEFLKKKNGNNDCPTTQPHLAKVKNVETSKKTKTSHKQKNHSKFKEYPQAKHNYKQLIETNKSSIINSADSITHPLYISLFPKQLHQLVDSESISKPWPIPFDHQIDGTEDTEVVVNPKHFSVIVDNHNQLKEWNCCHEQPRINHYPLSEATNPKMSALHGT